MKSSVFLEGFSIIQSFCHEMGDKGMETGLKESGRAEYRILRKVSEKAH
jgi:hypothetical protein